MKSVFFLALITVYLLSCCGSENARWQTRKDIPRTVTYTIRNRLTEPNFDLNQTLKLRFLKKEPFIRIMERAADADKRFRFSAEYLDWGYYITTINGVTGHYFQDGTFWAFLRAPSTFLDKGVSNYFPSHGEHIILNFTVADPVALNLTST